MNLTPECGFAFARGIGIAFLAVIVSIPIRSFLGQPGVGLRRTAWVLLLTTYLTPVILVGYAYSNFSLSLVHYPALNELLYDLLLLMKLIPVSALILYFAPSPISQEALHCRRLGRRKTGSLSFWVHGPARSWTIAFGLVFLFAFSEFEMASLLYIRSWTVSLFDAQTGGLSLHQSLRFASVPILCEALLLLAVMVMLLHSKSFRAAPPTREQLLGRNSRILVWAYLATGAAAVTFVPAVVVLRGTMEGLRILFENFVLGRDIAASVLFAFGSAVCAYLAAGLISGTARERGTNIGHVLSVFSVSVPGLLGALILSLLVLFVFQLPGLRAGYDTPLPLLIALTLLLLPFAVVLRILLHLSRPGEAFYSASLLEESPSSSVRQAAKRLLWQMKTRGQFWIAFLLFCWAYFDLTASSILAPSGMVPVSVRLYNIMHYGQPPVLSAMVCAASCIPVAVLITAAAVRGLFLRVRAHV